MDETTTAQGRRRHDRLSGDEASRAIYIDFEGLGRRLGPDGRRAAPAPVLLGVHTRGRGWRTSGVQQWTLQPAFAGMSDRHGDLSSAISHLVRRAERRDRRIVAWSNYELDAVRRYLEDPDLIARFERRYVNAKLLLRHWWNDRRRHEGPAPSALGAFLASLPDVPQDPAPGAVAATVDDLGRTLALGRPLTDRQRERWERVRDHNRRDCVGTRRLCLMATSDLASAESAAATGTTAVGTHASRIGRDAMRKPTSGLPNDADRPGRSTTTGREHPCPACGSRDVAWILYGLPRWSGELETKLSSGEVALGGCLPWAEAPRFTCHACNAGFRPGDAQETDG